MQFSSLKMEETMKKNILIYSNEYAASVTASKNLKQKLESSGYTVCKESHNIEDVDLIVCIGGDGTFLRAVHSFNFPKVPFIGINTGHLGFFQEISPSQLDDFIFNFSQDKCVVQHLSTVETTIKTKDATHSITALNEITIRGADNHPVHLNVSIGGSFIERFSGDGMTISTPSGSTGYNYSLGGSIIDPRLKILQATPIAPLNSTAYRSFTSSIMLPAELSLGFIPDDIFPDESIVINYDGMTEFLNGICNIEVKFSNKTVKLMRFETYDFWSKVKTKFL